MILHRIRSPRAAVLVAALALVVAGCVDTSATESAADPTTTTSTTTTTTTTTTSTTTTTTTLAPTTTTTTLPVDPAPALVGPVAAAEACPELPAGEPLRADAVSRAQVIQEASEGRPQVEAAVYPLPDYEGNPWSQWGQGLVLADGRFLSAVGDHRGEGGNSFIFEFDPATRELTRIADVLSLVDHRDGDWGYGKIHAQMVAGPCDQVWMATYWGSRSDLRYSSGYRGDLLLVVDPAARTIHNLGVVEQEHGVPSLAGSTADGLIYAEAVDPTADTGPFLVYDIGAGEVVFRDDDEAHRGFRTIAVDAAGRAYYSLGDGILATYDPETGTRSTLGQRIPGETLRAASGPDGNGTIYGVSHDPHVFFALDPSGDVRTLGEARGYTTSIALAPDGSRIFSVPDAHGGAWRHNAPLIAVATTDGREDVIVELEPLAERELGLRLGGTYSIAVDPSGRTVYLGMNAGPLDDDRQSGFGTAVALIVTLP